MDDHKLGREQANRLHEVVRRAGLPLGDVWIHYFSIGGEASEMELEAYLYHALTLPRVQRDMFAHALNELTGFNPSMRAPYDSDLCGERPSPLEDGVEEDNPGR